MTVLFLYGCTSFDRQVYKDRSAGFFMAVMGGGVRAGVLPFCKVHCKNYARIKTDVKRKQPKTFKGVD